VRNNEFPVPYKGAGSRRGLSKTTSMFAFNRRTYCHAVSLSFPKISRQTSFSYRAARWCRKFHFSHVKKREVRWYISHVFVVFVCTTDRELFHRFSGYCAWAMVLISLPIYFKSHVLSNVMCFKLLILWIKTKMRPLRRWKNASRTAVLRCAVFVMVQGCFEAVNETLEYVNSNESYWTVFCAF